MTVPPPGPLLDEAVQLAEALLGRVSAAAGGIDLSPELRERLAVAVADVAVAGAGLLGVVAEAATAWAERTRTTSADAPASAQAQPRGERIDIG